MSSIKVTPSDSATLYGCHFLSDHHRVDLKSSSGMPLVAMRRTRNRGVMSNKNTFLQSVSFRVNQVLFWVLTVTSEVKKQGSCFAPTFVPIFLCVFVFMCVCLWVGAHLPCTRVSMYMEVRGQLQLSFLRCVHLGYFSGLDLAKEARMATREPWGSSCFCFSCWNYNHVTQCLSFFFLMGFGDWTQIFIFTKQVFHSVVFPPQFLPPIYSSR